MTDLRSWRIPLPYERPPLSLNDRMHWAPANKIKQELRHLASWMPRVHKIPPLERVRVVLEWRVPDRRGRDDNNPHATLKPLVDGLVDGGLISGDSHDRVKHRVEIVYEKGVRATFLRIEELG